MIACLVTVDLSNNALDALSDPSCYPNVVTLDVGSNKLTALPDSIAALTNLITLNCEEAL